MGNRTCSIATCEAHSTRRGWCEKHYRRWYRTGTTDDVDVVDRFVAKYEKRPGGCWVWTGSVDRYGYGRFYPSRRNTAKAHRWSYEHFVGDIPEGLELDHLCRVRACVNPDHLEPVDHAENMARARKTACLRGHSFTPENTHRLPDGSRTCITCRRRRSREYKARQRAAAS